MTMVSHYTLCRRTSCDTEGPRRKVWIYPKIGCKIFDLSLSVQIWRSYEWPTSKSWHVVKDMSCLIL